MLSFFDLDPSVHSLIWIPHEYIIALHVTLSSLFPVFLFLLLHTSLLFSVSFHVPFLWLWELVFNPPLVRVSWLFFVVFSWLFLFCVFIGLQVAPHLSYPYMYLIHNQANPILFHNNIMHPSFNVNYS